MNQKKIIKCFIASPGDTIKERNICGKVFAEINTGIGVPYGFELKSLRWENDVDLGIFPVQASCEVYCKEISTERKVELKERNFIHK